ncbi:MAG: hypothetical protein ACI3WQ_00905 [Faecousia sp.]
MNGFNRFYLWGVTMKYHMGIYAVAGVFFKAIVNALQGVYSVDSLTMLEMLVVSLLFASAETVIFPRGREWGGSRWRMVLWAALANVAYVGSAFLFGWFRGVPVWGGILLIVLLEGAIVAMLYAMWLEKRWDTRDLNRSLKEFQGE